MNAVSFESQAEYSQKYSKFLIAENLNLLVETRERKCPQHQTTIGSSCRMNEGFHIGDGATKN